MKKILCILILTCLSSNALAQLKIINEEENLQQNPESRFESVHTFKYLGNTFDEVTLDKYENNYYIISHDYTTGGNVYFCLGG